MRRGVPDQHHRAADAETNDGWRSRRGKLRARGGVIDWLAGIAAIPASQFGNDARRLHIPVTRRLQSMTELEIPKRFHPFY